MQTEVLLDRFLDGLEPLAPLADRLHCTYLTPDTVGDIDRRHLTWAHRELFERPVTPTSG
ncbi:hypothetical protein [Streptomyces sp. NPDC093568]|uniref:hypothetical protein n=1 Tax=Streptomyces sp. NPDC093568 TaxID=3366041 RepID=UPI0038233C6A